MERVAPGRPALSGLFAIGERVDGHAVPVRDERAVRGRQLALLLCLAAPAAQAVEVRFEPVADPVHAFIGEGGARMVANEGLNAKLGRVVTPAGAVLIDSGTSWQGARQIQQAVGRVTPQPVRWVIDTGGQDHRGLGKGWFQARGAGIIGHAQARADMHDRGNDDLAALRATLGDPVDGRQPVLPTRWPAGADEWPVLGGVVFEFRHRGGAHTPGDLPAWLPQQRVLFSGGAVDVDRLPGVIPVSDTRAWLATCAEIEALAPARFVPGHGRVTDLASARADTRDHLLAQRQPMKKAADDGQDLDAAVRSFDGRPWLPRLNAAEPMPGNASRSCLELERE